MTTGTTWRRVLLRRTEDVSWKWQWLGTEMKRFNASANTTWTCSRPQVRTVNWYGCWICCAPRVILRYIYWCLHYGTVLPYPPMWTSNIIFQLQQLGPSVAFQTIPSFPSRMAAYIAAQTCSPCTSTRTPLASSRIPYISNVIQRPTFAYSYAMLCLSVPYWSEYVCHIRWAFHGIPGMSHHNPTYKDTFTSVHQKMLCEFGDQLIHNPSKRADQWYL